MGSLLKTYLRLGTKSGKHNIHSSLCVSFTLHCPAQDPSSTWRSARARAQVLRWWGRRFLRQRAGSHVRLVWVPIWRHRVDSLGFHTWWRLSFLKQGFERKNNSWILHVIVCKPFFRGTVCLRAVQCSPDWWLSECEVLKPFFSRPVHCTWATWWTNKLSCRGLGKVQTICKGG